DILPQDYSDIISPKSFKINHKHPKSVKIIHFSLKPVKFFLRFLFKLKYEQISMFSSMCCLAFYEIIFPLTTIFNQLQAKRNITTIM
ncbi:hypothetical protein, partial [Caldifermentibacillus hisashii]|uniref:hypothetical protein n=1 Tax=Caldifermentibacillus hisashii TaxID=996558 RepID=UPI0030E94BF0